MVHRTYGNRLALVARCLLAVSMLTAAPAVAAERGITVAGPAASPQGAWGTYHALIIGINAYQQWPQLRTAVKDATVLSRVMEDRYGFKKDNVILRTDAAATRLQISADIRELAAAMQPTDNLLVYFAGHGQLDDLTGDGYWIPVEGDAKNPSTWISNSYLKAIFSSERVAAKNVVVIADSCYSGAMLRGGPSLLTVDGDYAGKLAKAAARRSRQVISSGGLEPVVDGGAEGHSLFAYYFIKALTENDREVMDLENLFHTRVWKPVTEIGGQRPNVGRLKTPMDDDGQFILYNQAWVAEQRRAEAQQREEAERQAAAAASRQKAEAADQMAAIQAERQRIELERQKLEMEKQLAAQKQQLELQKLDLEKQKQALEIQKMAVQLDAMKQKSAMALAAIAPEAAQPTAPPAEKTISAALLPIYSRKISGKGLGQPPKWRDKSVNGLVDALGRNPEIKLTIADMEYEAFSNMSVRVAGDVFQDTTIERLWEKPSYFSNLPEPVIDEAVALGRRLGTRVVFLIRIGTAWPESGRGDVYLVDVATKKVFTKGGELNQGEVSTGIEALFAPVIKNYLSGR